MVPILVSKGCEFNKLHVFRVKFNIESNDTYTLYNKW